MLSAVVLDVFIYLLMKGSPSVRLSALRGFAVINISLLSLDALLTYVTQERLARPWRMAPDLSAVLECIAIVVWVQVTGSVSSYFIIAGPGMIMLYRGYWGHRASLTATATLVIAHVTAVV